MDLEDFLQPEVGVAVAITAALFSPRARRIIRRGLTYGTAGVLIAGDALTSFARNIGQGVQHMQTSGGATNQEGGPSAEESGG